MEFFFEHQLDAEYNLLLVVGQYVCGFGNGQSSINRRKEKQPYIWVFVKHANTHEHPQIRNSYHA